MALIRERHAQTGKEVDFSVSTPIVIPSIAGLPPLPPLDQIGQAAGNVSSAAGNAVSSTVKKVAGISGLSLFGATGSQILAIVLGLIFVIVGLLMFREVREPVVSAVKTAAVA